MTHFFQICDSDGQAIAPGYVAAESSQIGQAFVILNYPRIERYRVVRLITRTDWFDLDSFDRRSLVLATDSEPDAEPSNVIAFTPSISIVKRLAIAWNIAQEEIDENLTLRMSHKDFAALCRSIGVHDPSSIEFAAAAYRGVPIILGEPDNGSTQFEGFKGEMAFVKVTRRDGQPFEIDVRYTRSLLTLLSDPTRAPLIQAEMLAMMGDVVQRDPDLPRRVRDVLELTLEGELTVHLAAQELTEAVHRVQAA